MESCIPWSNKSGFAQHIFKFSTNLWTLLQQWSVGLTSVCYGRDDERKRTNLGLKQSTGLFPLLQWRVSLFLARFVPFEGISSGLREFVQQEVSMWQRQYIGNTCLTRMPPPKKTSMTIEIPPWMKMYFLLNMGIFEPVMLIFRGRFGGTIPMVPSSSDSSDDVWARPGSRPQEAFPRATWISGWLLGWRWVFPKIMVPPNHPF